MTDAWVSLFLFILSIISKLLIIYELAEIAHIPN